MNRLAFAATLLLPSIALAHPGHSHAGMSPLHHLAPIAALAVVAVGGYFAARLWNQKRSR